MRFLSLLFLTMWPHFVAHQNHVSLVAQGEPCLYLRGEIIRTDETQMMESVDSLSYATKFVKKMRPLAVVVGSSRPATQPV